MHAVQEVVLSFCAQPCGSCSLRPGIQQIAAAAITMPHAAQSFGRIWVCLFLSNPNGFLSVLARKHSLKLDRPIVCCAQVVCTCPWKASEQLAASWRMSHCVRLGAEPRLRHLQQSDLCAHGAGKGTLGRENGKPMVQDACTHACKMS